MPGAMSSVAETLSRKPCSHCGGSEFYVKEARFAGHAKQLLPLDSWFGYAEGWSRICGGCGLVQWFVTQECVETLKKEAVREL